MNRKRQWYFVITSYSIHYTKLYDFTPILQDAVNYVNAPLIAKERGIRVVESKTGHSDDFTSLLSIRVKTTEGENMLARNNFV